jgi:hypothetical protein
MVFGVERLSVANEGLDSKIQVHVQIPILSNESVMLNEVAGTEALLG